MTKSGLLAELAGRDFVSSVGTPELRETKPDGTKWYLVNTREIVGDAGGYRNVHFYVVDEGGGGEAAFYKDAPPSETSRKSALREWMKATVDANPNNYKGIQIHWISERWEMVIYTILEGSPLVQVTYYVRKGVGSPTEIPNFDKALLISIFSV